MKYLEILEDLIDLWFLRRAQLHGVSYVKCSMLLHIRGKRD
jgi:hypothetical protein